MVKNEFRTTIRFLDIAKPNNHFNLMCGRLLPIQAITRAVCVCTRVCVCVCVCVCGCNSSFYCASLYCTLQILHFFFTNWKFVSTNGLASSMSTGATFVKAFAHLGVSVSHFKLFHYHICYVICDQWYSMLYCNDSGHHGPWPHKTANFIDKGHVFWPLHQSAIPPRMDLLFPRDTTILKWGQWITLKWPPSVQMKGRVPRLSP